MSLINNCGGVFRKRSVLLQSFLQTFTSTKYASHLSSSLTGKAVRIGCASGFWGDTATSNAQLVQQGNIDFLVSDYLSEITMSLLTAAKKKTAEMGYAPDFVHFAIGPLLQQIKERGIKVISNAGGTNPLACAASLKEIAKKSGIDVNIAVVLGDDMMPKLSDLNVSMIKDMFGGNVLPKSVMSMNAYFGAVPIKNALDNDADIVITGRCVDSALVLAPLMHEFKWSIKDYDKLAGGSLAGHLLECGAQSTGGIFTDWRTIPGWDNIGFPIAECYADGQFLLTKPEGTGGLVSPATVAEQLVYEIGDPAAYILPDVTCDFSNVSISQHGSDCVKVTNAVGHPPPDLFKVCATYLDGFRCTAVFLVGGKNAIAKGKRTAESILKRVSRIFQSYNLGDFRAINVEAIGDEKLYGANKRDCDMRETMVWMAVEHDNKKALEIFTREIAAAGTGMAPGLCAFVSGRPKVNPVLKLFSFLHPKSELPALIHFHTGRIDEHHHKLLSVGAGESTNVKIDSDQHVNAAVESGPHECILEDLAYTRSGDKGNSANIGVIARHPVFVPHLRALVTADVVFRYFRHLFDDNATSSESVVRYELPGIGGFNFVLRNCLGGGGVASLRTDPQGKALGQMLLDLEIKGVSDSVHETIKASRS